MKTIRKLAGLWVATGMVIVMSLFHATASQAETVNQDPFDITVSITEQNAAWTSPTYSSYTGRGYACIHIATMTQHIGSWTFNLYKGDGTNLWGSPHEKTATSVCSPKFRPQTKLTHYYVRVRAYIDIAGTSGQLAGYSDIYTNY